MGESDTNQNKDLEMRMQQQSHQRLEDAIQDRIPYYISSAVMQAEAEHLHIAERGPILMGNSEMTPMDGRVEYTLRKAAADSAIKNITRQFTKSTSYKRQSGSTGYAPLDIEYEKLLKEAEARRLAAGRRLAISKGPKMPEDKEFNCEKAKINYENVKKSWEEDKTLPLDAKG